ncbi:MAG TPA: hypothetical protein PKI14_10025 [Fervidobacterium sp.]|nr:hypothetical protein [Fervidobacterium sp.]
MAERIEHPILNYDNYLQDNNEVMVDYIKNHLNAAEYKNFVSGKYGIKPGSTPEVDEAIQSSPFNNPKNNQKIYDANVNTMRREDNASWEKAYDAKLANRILFEKYKLDPSRSADNIMAHHEGDGTFFTVSSPNATPEGVKQVLSNKDVPVELSNQLITHPSVDARRKLQYLNDRHADSYSKLKILKELAPRLKEDSLVKYLNENPDVARRSPKSIAEIIDSVPDEKRTKVVDRILGIHGGELHQKPEDAAEDEMAPEDFGWANWNDGPDRSFKVGDAIAEHSTKLLPHQIEHIKRHGRDESRFGLFNNPNVDIEHHKEMYKKWLNDDEHHNYDLDSFKEHLKNQNEFNYEDYMDDANDAAEEEYPFSEYLRDYVDDDELMDGQDRDSWMEDHLDNNYDWSHTDDEGEEHDFSGADKSDHPEYDKRGSEASDAYDKALEEARSNAFDNDSIYNGYRESLSDREYELAREKYDEDMEDIHEKEKYLPEHLHGKLGTFNEIKKELRLRAFDEARDKSNGHKKDFETNYGYKPSDVHEYGDSQHIHELTKEFADNNGGIIDSGAMMKKFPNQKEAIKKVFADKGKLTSDELQQKIDAIPKNKYHMNYQPWNGMQRTNRNNEVVMQLDHSPESMQEIEKDPELLRVFNKISDVSQRSGHPTNPNTIAWSRVDMSNPKKWLIDEVQSDFGSTARDFLKKEGKTEDADRVQKIIDIHKNWREALTNHVLKEAKKHGVEAVYTHSPESKAAHTGAGKVHTVYQDSYQKVPRSMGFQPTSHENLPLDDAGKGVFEGSLKAKKESLENMRHQSHKGLDWHGGILKDIQKMKDSPEEFNLTEQEQSGMADFEKYHQDLYNKHKAVADVLTSKFGMEPHAGMADKVSEPKQMALMPDEVSPKSNKATFMPPSTLKASARAAANGNYSKLNDFDENISNPEYSATLSEPMPKPHIGHVFNLTPEAFKKYLLEAIDLMKAETKGTLNKIKIAKTLMLLKDNQETLNQIQQQNPEAYQNIVNLVSIMKEAFQNLTGTPIEAVEQQIEMQGHLDNEQPEEEQDQQQAEGQPEQSGGPNIRAKKDEPLHNRKLTYAPGSVRQYSSQNVRVKGDDGQWKSFGGGLKGGQEGQGGEDGQQ